MPTSPENNPPETKLLAQAAARGIPCAGGLAMVVAQKAAVGKYLFGREIPDEEIESVREKLAGRIGRTG